MIQKEVDKFCCPECGGAETAMTGAINFFCEEWWVCLVCGAEFRTKYNKIVSHWVLESK